MSELFLDRAGRRWSPATMPGFHAGRPPTAVGMLEAERQFCMITGFSDLAKPAVWSSGNSPVPSPTPVASQQAAIVATA
jgi:hypothetical protein